MLGSQISHYRLDALLGEGNFGQVFRGVHHHDEELRVAVKLLRAELIRDEACLENLKRECRALDRLDHPGIVRFRELAIREEQVAIVMELLEGEDLETLRSRGPQELSLVEAILQTCLEALAYAHGRGVLHRDIKPANLFRCSDGRIKLMDFGIARAIEGTQGTETGSLKGSLDYMAPERFGQQGSDGRADVYALGLVAWELLSGRHACPGVDLAQKLGWHMAVGPPDLRSLRPELPEPWAVFISGLTARSADERPDAETALAWLQGLDRSPVAAPAAQPPRASPVSVEFSGAELAAQRQERRAQKARAAPRAPTPAPPPPAPPRPPLDPSPLDTPAPSFKPSTPWKPLAAIAAVLALGAWLLSDGDPASEAPPEPAASREAPSSPAASSASSPASSRQASSSSSSKPSETSRPRSAPQSLSAQVSHIKASSSLAAIRYSGVLYDYKPQNLLDGDLKTTWQEGAPGAGIGESVTLHFKRPVDLDHLEIATGFQWIRSQQFGNLFLKNGRALRFELRATPRDGSPIVTQASLEDRMGYQTVKLQAQGVTRLQLTILGVQSGRDYPDTAISELRVWGWEE